MGSPRLNPPLLPVGHPSQSQSSDSHPSKPPPKKRARRVVITVTDSEHSDNLPTPPTQKVKTAPSGQVCPKSFPKRKRTLLFPPLIVGPTKHGHRPRKRRPVLHPLKKRKQGSLLPSPNQTTFTPTLMVRLRWQHEPSPPLGTSQT